MHPAASGEALGAASMRDFRFLVSCVANLEGGVYLNCGSAVLLPEVFLKAVALVRNRGLSLDGLTTVNFDFVRMYRPETNVVRRPVAGIGRGTRSPATTSSCCRSWRRRWWSMKRLVRPSRPPFRPLPCAFGVDYHRHVTAGVAQWLEHAAHIRSVRGSSPCTGTNFDRGNGPVRQRVHWVLMLRTAAPLHLHSSRCAIAHAALVSRGSCASSGCTSSSRRRIGSPLALSGGPDSVALLWLLEDRSRSPAISWRDGRRHSRESRAARRGVGA